MPVSILIRILVGAVATIGLAIAITGIISKTDIVNKIKEFARNHKYKKQSTNSNFDVEEDEDIIGAMIKEVTKNGKTVSVDVLNSDYEVVASEVFEGDGVSNDIYEGAIILI